MDVGGSAHGDGSAARRPHVVVVGGGIAGLAAALALRGRADVTVLERSGQVGGVLRSADVAGVRVDQGAESFLARVPDGLQLAREVGLEVVHPAVQGAALWLGTGTRGRLRPLPGGTLLGVPTEVLPVVRSRVLGPLGLARAGLDLVLPATPPGADPTVAAYVGARLGRRVVDRLVEPLLGGVYAGRPDRLSLASAAPQVAALSSRRSLVLAARAARRQAPATDAPVFATAAAGMGGLAAATAQASGATVRLGCTVRGLQRRPDGWRLLVGDTRSDETVDADAVLLAVPVAAARRLLAPLLPHADAALAGTPYASVAVTTLAYRNEPMPPGTGFLVPAVGGRSMKAATYLSRKWAHVAAAAPGLQLVRTSAGRHLDERELQRDDTELAGVMAAELAAATGLRGRPVDVHVTRWGGGLPQYTPGHADRLAALREMLPPGIAVAGAGYDGVGVPACIRSGQAAAEALLARALTSAPLGQAATSGGE